MFRNQIPKRIKRGEKALGLGGSTSYRMVMNQEGSDRNSLFQEVNANLMIVPQLESVTSIRNLGKIIQMEGIDYFGAAPS